MSYKARLNRMVNQFPKRVQWHDPTAELLANIKARAKAHIKANPQPRACFV